MRGSGRQRVMRIISGGQTGADRGALDAALELGIPHGGWCPRGRRAEDGPIDNRYLLKETATARYAERTAANVVDSDGTVIVSRGPLTGGSAITRKIAVERGRPHLHIDLDAVAQPEAHCILQQWLVEHDIVTLNVAGPRGSKCPTIAQDVRRLLVRVFAPDA